MAYPRRVDKAYLWRAWPPFLQAWQGDSFEIKGLCKARSTWTQCYPQKLWGTRQWTRL